MRDNVNTEAELGSEAVDTEFWELICNDESWLRAEFDGIVSEPSEVAIKPDPRPATGTGADGPGLWFIRPAGPDPEASEFRAGRTWQHQRSPPSRTEGVR